MVWALLGAGRWPEGRLPARGRGRSRSWTCSATRFTALRVLGLVGEPWSSNAL